MFHGSPDYFDTFDFMNTGKYTGNFGALGPGNYFSTGRNRYGFHGSNDLETQTWKTGQLNYENNDAFNLDIPLSLILADKDKYDKLSALQDVFNSLREIQAVRHPDYVSSTQQAIKRSIQGNMQPYLISDTKAVLQGNDLQQRGVLPRFDEIPEYARKVREYHKESMGIKEAFNANRINSVEYSKRIEKLNKKYPNIDEIREKAVKEIIDKYPLEENLVVKDGPGVGSTLLHFNPKTNSNTLQEAEYMTRQNTGIKSLFPHPSLLQRDANGKWFIPRDWNDPRVNYKNGGKLNW